MAVALRKVACLRTTPTPYDSCRFHTNRAGPSGCPSTGAYTWSMCGKEYTASSPPTATSALTSSLASLVAPCSPVSPLSRNPVCRCARHITVWKSKINADVNQDELYRPIYSFEEVSRGNNIGIGCKYSAARFETRGSADSVSPPPLPTSTRTSHKPAGMPQNPLLGWMVRRPST